MTDRLSNRRVSIRDVAQAAGVAVSTASCVLNERRDVPIRPSTRARVLEAAEALGYRPNGIARSLSRGKSTTIGLVLTTGDSSFVSDLIYGIQDICRRHTYRTLLVCTEGDPQRELAQIRLLLEHRVDGLIYYANPRSSLRGNVWMEEARREGVPCVVIQERAYAPPVDFVMSDDRQGTLEATRHLVSLGHTRIAYVPAGPGGSRLHDRVEGYRAGMDEAGLTTEVNPFEGPEAMNAEVLRPWLERTNPPTAFLAVHDMVAGRMIRAAADLGCRVPHDLAVVGFGDITVAELLGLTTIHQPARLMGQRAVERLLERIAEPERAVEGIIVPTHLTVRTSCGVRLANAELQRSE